MTGPTPDLIGVKNARCAGIRIISGVDASYNHKDKEMQIDKPKNNFAKDIIKFA